jgi:hypothetical protein
VWTEGYKAGYNEGYAKGLQARQAHQSGVANSLADVAKAWQQAQRDAERNAADNAEIARRNAEAVSAAGAAAIRHAAQPGRATNYGPFTGRSPGDMGHARGVAPQRSGQTSAPPPSNGAPSGSVGFHIPRIKTGALPSGRFDLPIGIEGFQVAPGWDEPMQTSWDGSILTFYESGIRHAVATMTGTSASDTDLSVAIMNWLKRWLAPDFFTWLGYAATPINQSPCPGLQVPEGPYGPTSYYPKMKHDDLLAQCTFKKAAFYFLQHRAVETGGAAVIRRFAGRPVIGSLSGPSGSVGGTCGPIKTHEGQMYQCVDSEYDVNDACIHMCESIKPQAHMAGFALGYKNALQGYSGQYVVPSVPPPIPFAYAPVILGDEGRQATEWVDTKHYCNVQAWNAWSSAFIAGYNQGHAKGLQDRQQQASGVANSLADVAKAWQQAQRDAERNAADNAEIARRNAEARTAALIANRQQQGRMPQRSGQTSAPPPSNGANWGGSVPYTPIPTGPRLLRVGPRVVANLITWDSKHPNWNGRYISFWSGKTREALGSMTKANSAYDVAGLPRRLSEQPDIETKISAWLRANWWGPVQFINRDSFYELPVPIPFPDIPQPKLEQDVLSLGWSSPLVSGMAKVAAFEYLNSVCHNAAGKIYNAFTGECAL